MNADLLDGQHAAAFQAALTNPVTGTGTNNYVAYWNSTGSTLGSEQYLNVSRGGTGISTTGLTGVPSINAGTWSVAAQLGVALGGTNIGSYTIGDMLYASAATTLSKVGIGTAGKILTTTGSAPAWTTATYPGTAATNGTLMQANGTNWVATTATYPGTAGTTGTILRSNGTNLINSTATYPDTVTSGYLLYASGSNVVGAEQYITNAQGGTGITTAGLTGVPVIAAGTWSVDTNYLSLAHGGTNANLTASNGGIVWTNGTQMQVLSANANAGLALVSGGAGAPTWFAPTLGSALFAGANGALTQDNANYFYDATNHRLGLGTVTPNAQLDVYGGRLRVSYNTATYNEIYTNSSGNLAISSGVAPTESAAIIGSGLSGQDVSIKLSGQYQSEYMGLDNSASDKFEIGLGTVVGTTPYLTILPTSGNVGIGTTNPNQLLTIEGTLGIGSAANHYSIFQGGTQAGDITYTLPTAQAGGSNYVLTNTAGALSWQSVSGVGSMSNPMTTIGDMVYASNTATPATPQRLAAGTTGQILMSNTGAAPSWSTATYPSTGGTAGTLMRSNGTNFVNSTATYPDTVTSGYLLYASGSNVVGSEQYITAAQGGTGINTSGATTGIPSISSGTWSVDSAFAWNSTNHYLTFGTSPQYSMGVDASDSNKFKIYAGTGIAGTSQFSIDTSGVTTIANLQMGAINFPADSGPVSWIDMPVVSATTGTVESYTAQLDGNPMLTIYGASDGSGGTANRSVRMSAPVGFLETGSSPQYYTYLQGGDQAADITYTLPTASTNGVLKNTAGVLSWDGSTYLSDGSVYALLAGRAGGQTLIGGTALNNTLTLQGTSASGNTAGNANLIFKVGDAGATTAMTILNNGNIGIGTTPSFKLDITTSTASDRGINIQNSAST